jgi:hypothetical protein
VKYNSHSAACQYVIYPCVQKLAVILRFLDFLAVATSNTIFSKSR